MGEKDLKVTDKRMFTADGELREEYRHLDGEGGDDKGSREAEAPAGHSAADPAVGEGPSGGAAAPPEPAARPAAASEPGSASRVAPPEAATAPAATPPDLAAGPTGAEPSGEAPRAGEPSADAPPLEIPGTPEGLGAPSFLDLVTLLAEPIALYLGDAELPDGRSAENLDMARLHIDLLDVLRQKTAGNLEVAEARLLEDLLYRCRLRYVQKRG